MLLPACASFLAKTMCDEIVRHAKAAVNMTKTLSFYGVLLVCALEARAHTASVGYLEAGTQSGTTCVAGAQITSDSVTCVDIEVFFGSWHKSGGAEGSLGVWIYNPAGEQGPTTDNTKANGQAGGDWLQIIGKSSVNPAIKPRYSLQHSLRETLPNHGDPGALDGGANNYSISGSDAYAFLSNVFTPGTNYFWSTGSSLQAAPDRNIYMHQSAMAEGLGAGRYRVGYEPTDTFTAVWANHGPVNDVEFVISAGGTVVAESGGTPAPLIQGPSGLPGDAASGKKLTAGQQAIHSFGIANSEELAAAGGADVTWSLSGGADQALFSIDGTSGALTFTGSSGACRYPDYPVSGNDYTVRITATSGTNTPSQLVALSCQPPTQLSVTQPLAGEVSVSFTAPATDEGATINNYAWSLDDGATWFAATPATVASPLIIAGLSPGTYALRIRAENANGGLAESVARLVSVAGVPEAPLDVAAMSPSPGQLALSFRPGGNGGAAITNYDYSLDGGENWVTLDPSQTSSPLRLSGIAAGSYTPAIRARNQYGAGSAAMANTVDSESGATTNVLSIAAPTVPDAPRNVVSSGALPGVITVAFDPPASDGGSPVIRYEYSMNNGLTWETAGSVPSSPLTIAGQAAGTYQLKLRAVNDVGAGGESSSSSVTVITVPPFPPTLGAVVAGNEQLAITFTAPNDTGGSPITNYQYSLDGGRSWVPFDPSVTSSPATITGLTNDQGYAVKLRAVNAAGPGAASATVSGTPVAAPDTAPPTMQSAVISVDGLQLEIVYDEALSGRPEGDDYGFSVDGSPYSGAITEAVLGTGADADRVTLHLDTAIPAGDDLVTNLVYTASAGAPNSVLDLAGNPAPDQTLATLTNRSTVSTPGPPAIGALVPGNGDMLVFFSAPGDDGGAAITRYTVTTSPGTVSATGASSPIRVSGLINGVTYSFEVTASNAQGDGPPSSPASSTPTLGVDAAPPAMVSAAVSPDGRSLFIDHDKALLGVPEGGDYSFSVDGSVYRGTITAASRGAGAEAGRITLVLDTPIPPGVPVTDLTYTSDAGTPDSVLDLSGNPAVTHTLSAVTNNSSISAPGAPVIGTVTPGNEKLRIDFDAPDNTGGAPLTNYQYSLDGGGWVAFDPPLARSPATIAGLSNDQAYAVRLRAVNAAGPGAASATVSGTPLEAQDTVPPEMLSAAVSSGGLQLEVTYSEALSGRPEGSDYDFSVSGVPYAGTITGAMLGAGAAADKITLLLATPVPPNVAVTALTYSADAGTPASVRDLAGNPAQDQTLATVTNNSSITVPGAPTGVVATAGDGLATVAFSAPADTGGAAISQFVVSSSPQGQTCTWSSGPLECVVTGLNNGTAYTFTARATNAVGSGPLSSPSSAVTPKQAQVITFVNPGQQDFGTAPALTASASSGLAVGFSSKSTGVCTVTDAGVLTFAKAGACTVVANQPGDPATLPAPEAKQTFGVAAIAPDPPTAVVAVSPARGSLEISFTAPASDGGSPITNYEYSLDANSPWVPLSPADAASPIAFSGVPGGTYTPRIRAVNSAGPGEAAQATGAVTVEPPTVPGAPTITAVSSPSAGRLLVVFDPPDDDGGAPIINYEYSLDGGASWRQRVPASSSTPLVISGLQGAVSDLGLRAVNAAGSGAADNWTAAVPVVPAPTEAAPVLVNESPPGATPGSVEVRQNGTVLSIQRRVEDGKRLILTGDEFQLRLSGDCGGRSCTIRKDENGLDVLEIQVNGLANLAGFGFLPGSEVDVWVFSEPVYLGSEPVQDDGTFEGSVQLEGIESGEHTLQVNGIGTDGAIRSANLGILVVAADAVPVPAVRAEWLVLLSCLLLFCARVYGSGVVRHRHVWR